MNKLSKAVNDRRKRIKGILINELGNKCCICGYNKYQGSLEFHHINPEEKDFTFGKMVSKSLAAIVSEIQKCVLVCSNCHKEVHAGLEELPKDVKRISQDFVLEGHKKHIKDYKDCYNACPICEGKKLKRKKYCSIKCSHIANRNCEWPTKEELSVLISRNTWVDIGKLFDVSDNAVRNWARYYKLI